MNNKKIIVWSGLMLAASLWLGYTYGYYNGMKEELAKGQSYPRYVVGEVSWKRSLNYQAEPFPPPKPMKLPPLAQPPFTQ